MPRSLGLTVPVLCMNLACGSAAPPPETTGVDRVEAPSSGDSSDGVGVPVDGLDGDDSQGATPDGIPAGQFTERVAALAAFGDQRIGPIGGGPVMPSQDVLCARELVHDATPAQLERLLTSDNPAIRAHVAREIIHHRPEQLALVNLVAADPARILVGSMDDVPPIRDRPMTIAEVVEGSLSYTGLTLP